MNLIVVGALVKASTTLIMAYDIFVHVSRYLLNGPIDIVRVESVTTPTGTVI